MNSLSSRRPSPAMVVACVALSFALAGSAVAGTEAVTSTLDTKEKKQVKKISKRQANKQIKKKAPGLSVAHATTATSANTASSAASAGNADKLDNLDSSDFLPADSAGIALAGAQVAFDGSVNAWFNRFGGQPTVNKLGTGAYILTFPGLEGQLFNNQVVHIATLALTDVGEIRVGSSGGNPFVATANSSGTDADRAFYYTVFGTNLAP